MPFRCGMTPFSWRFRGPEVFQWCVWLEQYWFVVSNICYFPCRIWDVILPIDKLHHFSRWLLHHQPEWIISTSLVPWPCSQASWPAATAAQCCCAWNKKCRNYCRPRRPGSPRAATRCERVMSYNMLLPIGSMYGIYANIWGILMVNVTIYIAYMDPMGYTWLNYKWDKTWIKEKVGVSI